MSDTSESNDDKSRNRSVVYVYSPEYTQTSDSLSKVPNRVRWTALQVTSHTETQHTPLAAYRSLQMLHTGY